jgi:protoporphyrinogen oxidase
MGVEIKMGASVKKLKYENSLWSVLLEDDFIYIGFDAVISTAPLKEIIAGIYPVLPEDVLISAKQLRYRDFITVVLILPESNAFSENWIYIHDPSVKVGRIQNFKSWSKHMVPDDSMVCYGLEYFCFEDDGLWNSSDADLISLAKNELEQIGLAKANEIVDGHVVRQAKAYPVYDKMYKQHILKIRQSLLKYPGIYLTGRNGMHKYNNQDHSMMTAMLAAKNIIAGKDLYDLWKVNEDAAYHEDGTTDLIRDGRMIPEKKRDGIITVQDKIVKGLA